MACVQSFEPFPQPQRYNYQISDLSAGPWAGRGGQEEIGYAGMRRSGQDVTNVPVLGILLACLKLLEQGWGECIRWSQEAVQRSSSPEEKSSRPHPPGQKSSQAPGRPIPGALSVPRCCRVGISALPALPPAAIAKNICYSSTPAKHHLLIWVGNSFQPSKLKERKKSDWPNQQSWPSSSRPQAPNMGCPHAS